MNRGRVVGQALLVGVVLFVVAMLVNQIIPAGNLYTALLIAVAGAIGTAIRLSRQPKDR